MAPSQNTKSVSRGNSTSPTDKKSSGNGGVMLPTNMGLHESERAANVHSPFKPGLPQWNGQKQSTKPNTNGGPFDKETFAANGINKLSAGASPFKPVNGNGKARAPPTPINLLNRDSTADDQPTIVTSPTPNDGKASPEKSMASTQEPIGTRSGSFSPTRQDIFFTTDVGVPFQGCHYVKVSGVSKKHLESFGQLMKDFDWETKLYGKTYKAYCDGDKFTYFFCFDDLRDTTVALQELEMAQSGWPVSLITQTEYANAPTNQYSNEKYANDPTNQYGIEKSLYHDGQVIFSASFDGPTAECDLSTAEKTVHDLAIKFGEMRAFTKVTTEWPMLEFRAEYYRIGAAKDLINSASKDDPLVANKWNVVPTALPDYSVQANSTDGDAGMQTLETGMNGIQIAGTPHRTGSGDGVVEFASPTGRTAWTTDSNGNCVPSKPLMTLPKVASIPFGIPIDQLTTTPIYRDQRHSAPGPQTPHHIMHGVNMSSRSNSWNGNIYYSKGSPERAPIPGPQSVDLAKIEKGWDVRTTVMMRNIPNRMTCHNLKDVLDSVSFGKYDFSYLRIDFEKGTNVGYAFVNFQDPMDIIPFVKAWNGKRWQFNNPRQVELSYATVQGYDCLVEKFRNSAIMEEFKDYRPKLWYTDLTSPTDDLTGTEVEFPKPNNWSKRQRSHDNAGQIGLYAPRSQYGHFKGPRRSQYDRGTPAQMQEDAYYHMSPVQNGYGYGYGYPNNGYGMAPRMPVGPPPPFQMMYGNGYDVNPYMNGNGYPQNQGYGYYDNSDPFYHGGHGNGYNNGFGTGPGTPASRRRTHTGGKLGGHTKRVITVGPPVGGPVQSPAGGYGGYGSPEPRGQPMPQVVEEENLDGYNNTPGPFYCPRF